MLGTTSWLLWTASLVAPSALTSPPVMAPEAPIQRELAGRALDEYPWFAHNLAFNQGTPVRLAIDTRRFPELANQTFDVYVVAQAWRGTSSLSAGTGSPPAATWNTPLVVRRSLAGL